MQKKIVLSAILFLFFVPIYFQVTRANAENHLPLTPPLTNEVTPTMTPTHTPTPTSTPTPTNTPTPTATPTSTVTPTGTPSVTPTLTPTPTPTTTPDDDEGTLSGKVMLRAGSWVFRSSSVSPAAGVKVQVEPFFEEEDAMTDTTDSQGNYSFDLPEGLYMVSVEEEDGFFSPPFAVKRVSEDRTTTANFTGLEF